MKYELIPQSLKLIDNWIVWKLEERNGKKSKTPYRADGTGYAKTNDPNTWVSFEQALSAYESSQKAIPFSGVGFIVKASINGQQLIGIDIDYPADSEIAQECIAHFSSTYCEKSPSGKLRIFCTGSKESIARCKGNDSKIEVYDDKSPRYLTVTGEHIENTHTEITHCQDGLNWLLEKYFKKEPEIVFKPSENASKAFSTQGDSNSLPFSENDVLEHLRRAKNASKFEGLFNGSGHKDESTGDLILCSMIAFYSQSKSVVDNVFRQSQRTNLKNGKWDKKHNANGETYGQITIRKAIMGLKTTYNPHSYQTTAADARRPQTSNWQSRLAISENKEGELTMKSNFYNLLILLENDHNLKDCFRFNELTSKVIVNGNNIMPAGELEDGTISVIREYLANAYQHLKSHHIKWEATETLNAVLHIARKNSYHPIKDYLNSLKWDGIERISHFFSDYCGTKKDEYTDHVAKSFFISAVARVMAPGCKVDTMLILEGVQGLGKSSLLRALCKDKEWFRDSAISLESKDAYTGLRGKWIIEMSELDSLNKAETTRIKSFISSPIDSYRPPYGRCDIDVPRQCVFTGTTNKSQYLKDETGNRRFLPVQCEYISIEDVEFNRDMLWAEAVTCYNMGELWYLDKGNILLRKRITEEQEDRYEEDAWSNAIAEWIVVQEEEFTITKIAQRVLQIELADITRQTETRIGKILKSLGYERERKAVNGKRSYFYNPNKVA
jgi:predicted P-loop ATPase